MIDPLERRINRAVFERDVAAARRAGAEEMRERAAKLCEAEGLRVIPDRIRALPVE